MEVVKGWITVLRLRRAVKSVAERESMTYAAL
jgi:hypothetical protein